MQVLLYSERILKESNDRALLKNLGTWLGFLTFARNKPVLSRDLELKHVICEAYQRGRLIAVLPFVQKLLEGCRSSVVFKPTNPMIAGILSLLAELHAMKVPSRLGCRMGRDFDGSVWTQSIVLPEVNRLLLDSMKSIAKSKDDCAKQEFLEHCPLQNGAHGRSAVCL